jgi:hypothetical protein
MRGDRVSAHPLSWCGDTLSAAAIVEHNSASLRLRLEIQKQSKGSAAGFLHMNMKALILVLPSYRRKGFFTEMAKRYL